MFKNIVTFQLIALFGFCITPAIASTYTFGLVPQQSATKMAQNWIPVLNYLSEQTGDTYVFKTAKDIPTFEQRLINGEYDFAYMNPYHFTIFNQKPGYQAFAKQKNKGIQGIFVVNKNSEIKTLADLEGKKIAFPSPAAFAASIILQAQLHKQGISFTPQYVSSHDSVYLNVAQDNYASGGGIQRTFNNTSESTKNDLTILWKSPKYTPHAFAVHPRIEQQALNSLINAMLNMHNTPQGENLLQKINIPIIEQATNNQWEDVKNLDIQILNNLLNL